MQGDNLSHWESNLDRHSWHSTHVKMEGAPWCSSHWPQLSNSTFGLLGPCAKGQVKYLIFNNTLPWKKNRIFHFTPQGIRIFLRPFIIKRHWKKQGCQLTWRERKVKFYKSPKTPPAHHLVHQKANDLSPSIPSFIQLFTSSPANALKFDLYGALKF